MERARHRHDAQDVPQRPAARDPGQHRRVRRSSATPTPSTTPPFDVSSLSFLWMTRVKRPGFDGLGDDEPWQVEESGLMTARGLRRASSTSGWAPFQAAYLNERVAPGKLDDFIKFVQGTPRRGREGDGRRHAVPQRRRAHDAVRVPLRRPLVHAVRLRPVPHARQGRGGHAGDDAGPQRRRHRRLSAAVGAPGIWIGGWRSASKMLAQPLWDRFVFPYLERDRHAGRRPPASSRSCTSTPTGRATCRGCSSCRRRPASSRSTA